MALLRAEYFAEIVVDRGVVVDDEDAGGRGVRQWRKRSLMRLVETLTLLRIWLGLLVYRPVWGRLKGKGGGPMSFARRGRRW